MLYINNNLYHSNFIIIIIELHIFLSYILLFIVLISRQMPTEPHHDVRLCSRFLLNFFLMTKEHLDLFMFIQVI